eukprot:gene15517-15012_t
MPTAEEDAILDEESPPPKGKRKRGRPRKLEGEQREVEKGDGEEAAEGGKRGPG